MLQAVYYTLFILTLFYGMYFLITGFWGFKKNKYKIKKYDPKHKIAVVIAARNEEVVIGSLVKSLKDQDYPKKLYDIFVVVNNCTDNTEKAAKEAGAKTLSVDIPVKSKGEVLKWAFAKLYNKDYDAFIVFDADNVVASNFVSRMNDTLCDGYTVALGCRDSKNLSDNWLSSSYSIFYYLQNFFFNRARHNMHLSGALNGTGFMIKKEVIKDGFNTYTLTEDTEFTAQCAINKERIAFVEDALTYDEQPVKFKVSWKQRKRWSIGTFQCSRRYSGELLKHYHKDNNLSCFDMFMVFLAPSIQLLAFALIIVLIAFRIFGVQLYDIFSYLFAYTAIFFVVAYLIGVIMNIFILKYNHRKVKDGLSGVLLFFFFIITWVPINIACLIKKSNKWEPIPHNRNVDLKNFTK